MDAPVQPKLQSTVDLLLAVGWLTWLVAWLPKLWWPLEVAGNFPVQITVGGALMVAVCAWLRDLPRLALALGLVVAASWPVIPWLGTLPAAPPSAEPLVLSLHNVLRINPTPHRVVDEIERWQPDFVVLMEVSAAWAPTLARLDATWPTSVAQPADHNFGIAARARLPWQSAEIISICDVPAEHLPAIDLRLTHAGRPLRVLAVHLVPPMSAQAAALRQEQVDGLVREIRTHPELPTVVIGDLNTTMFSATYRQLLADSGLSDARAGHGLMSTWPARMPSWGRLALDHVLVPDELTVIDIELGEPTGSDHRGLRVALQWR